MNFEEALKLKKLLESPYQFKDVQMSVNITPNTDLDFKSWLKHYKFNKVSDETAKLFSSDGKYSVYGIGPRIEFLFWEKLS